MREQLTWELWSEEDHGGRQCVTAYVDVEVSGQTIKPVSYFVEWSDSEFCMEPLVRWLDGVRLVDNDYDKTPFAPLIDAFQNPKDIEVPKEVIENYLEFAEEEQANGIANLFSA